MPSMSMKRSFVKFRRTAGPVGVLGAVAVVVGIGLAAVAAVRRKDEVKDAFNAWLSWGPPPGLPSAYPSSGEPPKRTPSWGEWAGYYRDDTTTGSLSWGAWLAEKYTEATTGPV